MESAPLQLADRAMPMPPRHCLDMDGNPEQIIGDIVRKGRIASVVGATCTVETGDLITPPLPWFAVRAGNVRKWSAPSVGEGCLLICAEGDTANGIVLPGLYSDQFPAPGTGPDLDVTEYADGALIQYDQKAHALCATLPSGGTAKIIADGGIKLIGDVEITGNLNVSKKVTASNDVIGGGISLKSHTHPGVKAGSDTTGAPQ
jgi:phage baseplate assembly protein V